MNSVNATQFNALDSISRQAAIKALDKRFDSIPMEQTTEILLLRRDLRELPPTQPELIEKEAYIRGFEQGRTQGMIDSQSGKREEMNKQRKVLITTTYNEMGIIIDTKAEEVAQPLNQDSIETQSSDLISRQAALELCDWYDNPSMREDLEKLRPARFSTDTINRQAAIETVMECYDNAELFEVYEEKLRELPPAQPESDSGRWERHYSRPGVYADLYWHCSKCGYKTDYQYANVNHHYCPHCGRKMEREVSNE